MSGNENQESTIAVNLCKTGCGFYGLTQFDGMCSVCYKEHMKKRQKQDEEQIQKPVTAAAAAAAAVLGVSSSASSLLRESASDEAKPDSNGAATPLASTASATAKDADKVVNEVKSEDAEKKISLESAAKQQDEAAKSEGCSIAETGVACAVVAEEACQSDTKPESANDEKPRQKQRNRCGVCKKRIGLTGFECRCGGVYCAIHRYSDKHECDFDYQSLGQEQIRKANPLVVSAKIDKL